MSEPMDLCQQCSSWTSDTWAICADCRAEGFYNIREDMEKESREKVQELKEMMS